MSFDWVAPFYDGLVRLFFGRSLLRAQQHVWWRVPVGASVLILGGGTGTLLPHFLRARRPRRVVYLEASRAMLHRAHRHVPEGELVTFRHGTEMVLQPDDQFDAILLPFVLDLYPDPVLAGQLVPRLLAALSPAGGLYVSDFNQPQTRRQRISLALMLLFFRLTVAIPARRLPNWPAVLRELGLTEQQGETYRRGQLRSGCWVRTATVLPAPAERPSAA